MLQTGDKRNERTEKRKSLGAKTRSERGKLRDMENCNKGREKKGERDLVGDENVMSEERGAC